MVGCVDVLTLPYVFRFGKRSLFGAVASYETPLRRRALAANQTALAQAHMSDCRSPAPLSSSLPPMARCGDGALRATAEVRPCQG